MKNPLTPITKIDLDEALEKQDGQNRQYRDQILTGLDGVMKELQTIREEMIVSSHHIQMLKDDVDNHQKRLTKLESPKH